MVGGLSGFFSRQWGKWLDKRLPPSHSLTFDQRKIFILPTGQGILFAFTAFLFFIIGVNYSNSMVLMMSFFLGSLFIISVLHTYRNLSGLTIKAGITEPSFVGGEALFRVSLYRGSRRTYQAIKLQWGDSSAELQDLTEVMQAEVSLLLNTKDRGVFRPGRLKIETRYPVGLMRAWSWVDLDMTSIVYPEPKQSGFIPMSQISESGGEGRVNDGKDDFESLKAYVIGDSLKNVAWKAYARGQGLYSKVFQGHVQQNEWLDWDQMPGDDTETKLSYLCYRILYYSENKITFGLRLPSNEFGLASGAEHTRQCLHALALF